MKQIRILLSLWLSCAWTQRTLAEINQDGICNVVVLAPFVSDDRKSEIYGLDGNETGANLGFLQLAAALLAVQHFNSRNYSIVPEIANISSSCNVKLNISKVFNAVSGDNSGVRWMARNNPPCAIVGGNDDSTGNEVKVVARLLSVPYVATRTFDPSIASYEFSSSLCPNLEASAYRIAQYLQFKGRTNYIAFLYEESAVNLLRLQAIANELDKRDMKRFAISFSGESEDSRYSSVYAAMERIKDIGYRTIIIAQEDPWTSYQLIADAADELKMNRGEHFYLWYGEVEPTAFYTDDYNADKLVAGSAWIAPLTTYARSETDDLWRELGADLINSAIALNPFGPGELGYVKADSNFSHNVTLQFTCSEMFDAIITVGIGACKAQAVAGSSFVNGSDHQKSIRESQFHGLSGPVKFDQGSRSRGTVYWTAVNFLANETFSSEPDWLYPIGYEDDPEDNDTWFSFDSFVYADGTTTPPALLIDTPEQNYIWVGLRIVGFTLMGINMALATVCAGWVFVCRKHKIVTASQPVFLYLICFGALVQTSAIVPASFDESNRWSTKELSDACIAIPWLFTLGYMMVYSSLFSKLWRINKVLQFTKRQIKIQQVVWPMAVLVAVELVLLILWTVLEPLQWERVEINSVTGESIGSCASDNTFAFVAALAVVMLVPSVLTLIMAWKTKDVDDLFSESRWIFVLILLQTELALVAVPVLVILSGKSSNGKYLAGLFFFWAFPMSTLGLIFFPKIAAYWQAVHGKGGPSKPKRGQRGNARVTGDYINIPGAANQIYLAEPHGVSEMISTEKSDRRSTGVEAHDDEPI